MKRRISRADDQLLAALAAAGIPGVKTRRDQWKRKLEDWRHDDLYPPAERRFPGGGGSIARYSDETVAQVVELVELMEERARKDEAALVLFYRGRAISTETARRAHLSTLARLDNYLRSFTPSIDDYEIAEAAALGLVKRLRRSKQGRAMLAELRRSYQGGDAVDRKLDEEVLASALTNAILIVRSGRVSTEEGVLELLKSLRLQLPAFGEENNAEQAGWALPPLSSLFASCSITNQMQAVKQATATQLVTARRQLDQLLHFLEQVAGYLATRTRGGRTEPRILVPQPSERVAARFVPVLLTAQATPWVAEALPLLNTPVRPELLRATAATAMGATTDQLAAMT